MLAGLSLQAMLVPRASAGGCAGLRRWRHSEWSRAAAISVIPVTAIGAGKLSSSAVSWTKAAATAQIRIAAAAQAMAR